MYPPHEKYTLCAECTNINWEPVPVQTVPEKFDYVSMLE